MSGSDLLKVSNISWSASETKILDDISFEIKKGSFVGLIGPNGAGKSSLMRCIYRVNKPDTGSVLFEGQKYGRYSARAKRAFRFICL